jgi:branched-chain amino acid transport system ATP-binding protein
VTGTGPSPLTDGTGGPDGREDRPPAEPAAGGVLELEDIRVRFGGIVALDGVGLAVDGGEICGIIGPNGAGKTTLFDVISGLRAPTAGRVRFDGRDVTSWPAVRRSRQGVRRTFQRVQPYGWLDVADNVLAALEWRGGGGGVLADLAGLPTRRRRETERRARAEEVLERCGLTHVRDASPASLPIGLARMVELARALVDEPRLLLLDEPTSGLDRAESERLADQIRTVKEATGSPVLLVEHDMGFVMEVCERVVVLDRGRVLASGTPREIQSNSEVREAYLG